MHLVGLTAGPVAVTNAVTLLIPEDSSQRMGFLFFLAITALSLAPQAAALSLVSRIGRDQPIGIGQAVFALITFGPRYIASAIVVFAVFFGLYLPIYTIPIGIYVLVRLGLFGPLIITENLTIIGALRRSWLLVQGRWWRTAGVFLLGTAMAAIPFGCAILIQQQFSGTTIWLITTTLAGALSLPLISALELLLLAEYTGTLQEYPSTSESTSVHYSERRPGSE